MPKTETLNLRVSAEFKNRLMEEAKKDKRSVTNYLEATLARFWKERRSQNKQIEFLLDRSVREEEKVHETGDSNSKKSEPVKRKQKGPAKLGPADQ